MPSGCQCTETQMCPRCQHYLTLPRVEGQGMQCPVVSPLFLPARGRVTTPQYESKLEARYADYLTLRQRAGDLHQWWAKPGSIRLGYRHHYEPDFLLQLPDGFIQYHDTKGRMREDSWKAIKMAAHLYPCFLFVVVREERQAWVYTEVHR